MMMNATATTTTKIRFFVIIGIAIIGNIFHLSLINKQLQQQRQRQRHQVVLLFEDNINNNKNNGSSKDGNIIINSEDIILHHHHHYPPVNKESYNSDTLLRNQKLGHQKKKEQERRRRRRTTTTSTIHQQKNHTEVDYFNSTPQKKKYDDDNANNISSSTNFLSYDDLIKSITTNDGKLRMDINLTTTTTTTALFFQYNENNNNNMFCLPWTVNSDDWWTHQPKYYISKENGTHYCFSLISRHLKQKYELYEQIYQNQFQYQNENQNRCHQVITQRMWQSGFGADMSHVVEALLYGLSQQRPIQVSNDVPWHYAKPKMQHRNSRRNIVQKNKHTTTKNNANNIVAAPAGSACPLESMYCYFLNLTNCLPNNTMAYSGTNTSEYFVGIPKLDDTKISWLLEYTTRQQTWLRYEVWKFTKKFASSLLLQQQKSPSSTSKCSVIHVRRSDVVLHGPRSRRYHPLEDYINALPSDIRESNNNNNNNNNISMPILLLTDDSNAIVEATTNYPEYNWVYIDRPRFNGSEGGWENQIPSQDVKHEIIVLMSIFKLVRRCNVFVHTTSNLASYIAGIMKTGGNNNRSSRRRNTVQIINLDSNKGNSEIYNYNNSIM